MKDAFAGRMSTNIVQPTTPLRPIPIHLTRPPGLDSDGFRQPLSMDKPPRQNPPLSMDKPPRQNPPLWNPAIDLSTTPRKTTPRETFSTPRETTPRETTPRETFSTREPNLPKKPKLSDPRSGPSTSTSSILVPSTPIQNSTKKSQEPKSPSVKYSQKTTTFSGGTLKTQPMMGALLYEQFNLHFPGSIESPLAVLASKGLFPTFLGVQEPVLPRSSHPVAHNLPMPIPERHISLQNAISFAQSRTLMERMSSSSQHNQRDSMDHLQKPHQLQLHQSQQQQQQASPNSQLAIPNASRYTAQIADRMHSLINSSTQSHLERPLPMHNTDLPRSERHKPMHNTDLPRSERHKSMHSPTAPHSERHLHNTPLQHTDRHLNLHTTNLPRTERPPHLHNTAVPHQDRPIQLHNTPLAQSERHISLHSAFSHAHSRAILERINNNPILSPVISLDNAVAHGYGRKLFPCPQCRYTTDRRNNLKRHMLTMHQTSSKMLECCGILFNTKASLREHAMVFHYHGYTCYFCGRRFCRKALLKRHLSVHNGQKDFVCNMCDYATSHKSNLERHRKVHSRQDDGKDGEDGQRYHDDDARHYHDDVKSNGSEALSPDDASSDDLSVCSDYDDDDDTDVEINVHSD